MVVLPWAGGEGQHIPSSAWPASKGCSGSELELVACSDQELPLVTHFQERHQAWVTPSGHCSSCRTQHSGLFLIFFIIHSLEAVFLLPAKSMDAAA